MCLDWLLIEAVAAAGAAAVVLGGVVAGVVVQGEAPARVEKPMPRMEARVGVGCGVGVDDERGVVPCHCCRYGGGDGGGYAACDAGDATVAVLGLSHRQYHYCICHSQ